MSAHSESCITRNRFGLGRKEFDLTNGIPCEECYEQPRQGDMAGVRALCSDCIEDHPAKTTGRSGSAQTPSTFGYGVFCCVRVGLHPLRA